MKTNNPGAIKFRDNARRAIDDQSLRRAMRHATETFRQKRSQAIVGIPFEEWREQASELRKRVISDLEGYTDEFAANATRRGAIVHRVANAGVARKLIGDILKDNHAKSIVKSKSMVTEEIHLNKHLEELGLRVIETDLGEYIVQIAGETPSHIIVPAIHKSREQIVCPIYGPVSGHAYESTYPGPMGVILSTLLNGLEHSHPLLDATTLCGACSEVCPVKVPLLKILYELREKKVDSGYVKTLEKFGMLGFGLAASSPFGFQTGQSVAKTLWPLARFFFPVTVNRLPVPADRTFKRRMS